MVTVCAPVPALVSAVLELLLNAVKAAVGHVTLPPCDQTVSSVPLMSGLYPNLYNELAPAIWPFDTCNSYGSWTAIAFLSALSSWLKYIRSTLLNCSNDSWLYTCGAYGRAGARNGTLYT